jgi:hypothetical protein
MTAFSVAHQRRPEGASAQRRAFLAASSAASLAAAAGLFSTIPLAHGATSATKPGTRSFRWIEVAQLSGGAPLRLPLHDIRGLRDGPTLSVTAAIHGWEILGIEVVRRLLDRLGVDFAGRILAVPVANPPAFQTQSRHSPLDSQDLDHVFPGSEGGWVTARIAHHLAREVIAPADFYIDIHGGDYSCTVNYAMGSTREVALLSGFPVVRALPDVFQGAPNLSGTTVGHAMALGKPAMGFEVGAGFQADELCIDTALRAILNAMRSIGMLRDAQERAPLQWVVRHTRVLRVNGGGLFVPALPIERINQPVSGGTVLGRVVDPYTLEVAETLTAPWERGVLMMHKAGIVMVEAGFWVFNVGNLDTAEEVRNS